MFANATFKVGISQRVVATLVACAVVLMSVGIYNIAQAANLSTISDTLSDSLNSVDANHYIVFTVPASGGDGVAAGETITVTFPSFDLTGVVFGDIDMEIAGAAQTLAAAPSGATWGAVVSGQVLTFTSGTGTVTPGQTVEIWIGTNATGGVGNNQINNPASFGSYELAITAGNVDTGRTRVAIVDDVLVEAIVDTTFTFTITGTATSTSVNGVSTTGSTSPTSINFGQLIADDDEILAQRLNVLTNANNGFVVTVETDGDFASSNGAVIDDFTDGTHVNTPTAWAVPGDTIGDETTWGHWGLTSTDDLNADEFGSNGYVAASTTPRQIFAHDGPSDGVTNDVGSSTIAYRVEITPLQEAADDYNAVLTYIATPTF